VGGGSAQRLHEASRFVREEGRWLYVDDVSRGVASGDGDIL
jgi:uncharacterized protein YchJ